MSHPFVRVDLSPSARDFRNVLVQTGLPLLDKSAVHVALLNQWLGRDVAHVDREGETFLFFVRNEDGSLPEAPDCRPATAAELRGRLGRGLRKLQDDLGKIQPKTPRKPRSIASSRSISRRRSNA